MNPINLGGPAVEPIALADAKAWLRVDGDGEDELVSALIVAGRLTVERATRLRLVEQTWRVAFERWPSDRAVPLPLWPIISVDAVRVRGGGGAFAAIAPELYRLDLGQDPARLLVDPAAPEPDRKPSGIEIDLTAGFGAAAASVPEPLRLAIRRLVAHWFERRGDEPAADAGLPADVAALIAPYRRARLA